jgi:hypothetical protein
MEGQGGDALVVGDDAGLGVQAKEGEPGERQGDVRRPGWEDVQDRPVEQLEPAGDRLGGRQHPGQPVSVRLRGLSRDDRTDGRRGTAEGSVLEELSAADPGTLRGRLGTHRALPPLRLPSERSSTSGEAAPLITGCQ